MWKARHSSLFFKGLSSAAVVSTITSLRFINSNISKCDDQGGNPLMDQANAARDNNKPKIKTPADFESCKNSFHYVSTNSYDGFRFVVQKQVNLNSVVNHFYWTGAQQLQGGSFYQYRIILPINDNNTVIDASSTMDSEVSVNIKQTVSPQIRLDCQLELKSQQPKGVSLDVHTQDDNSTMTGHFKESTNREIGFSMTQAITPEITVGAHANFNVNKSTLSKAFFAKYDQGENEFSALIESNRGYKALYLRRVNPGRVNVYTDFQVNGKGDSEANLGAEFTLKTSKLNMSVDSNFNWKSTLETQLMRGVNLNFAAEINQLQDQYKYGLSLQLM